MTELPIADTRRAIGSIAKALAAFQSEMPTVAKTHRADVRTDKGSYGYTYADLADVSGAVMPLLSKHGLAFSTLPTRRGDGFWLVGLLLHESGEYIEATYPLPTSAAPQQLGSALTYGRRYLLGCMTGVVTDDDDDGQLAQQTAARKQRQRSTRQAPSEDRPPSEETGEQISPAQLKKLGALMGELEIRDRTEALGYVANVIGRNVESRNDLTKSEAHKVIEALIADVERSS